MRQLFYVSKTHTTANHTMRLAILPGILFSCAAAMAGEAIQWSSTVPPLPDKHGYAGGFAGIVGQDEHRLLVFAGGANFPYENPFDEAKNADGGQPKVFHRSAFALSLGPGGLSPDGGWKAATPLPQALAYGASVSLPHDHSALFIGGNSGTDGAGHSAKVYRITSPGGAIQYAPLADLPVGVTNIAATLVGKTVYVFSGDSPKGSEPQFLALDTSDHDAAAWQWKSLPWPQRADGTPARARGNYTIGSMGGKVYVFGGRSARDPSDTTMHKVDINEIHGLDFFRDCYVYAPGTNTWKRIADLPMGISAAPSPAVPAGYSHLLVLGGVS
ncbi:MAG: hypothetical protein KDK08_29755, partial [Rhizobiaceae bacterium]|nr:hypothetical protein [Rhizobiaceae bacterium]